MTKRQKILNCFNSIEWYEGVDGELAKSIEKSVWREFGLYGDIENASQHCDLIYARKIIQSLGHKVIIGGAFHVWKDKLKNKR